MSDTMTLAMVADMLDVAHRWEFRDCDDLAIVVRKADKLLDEVTTYIKVQSGGRCFADGMKGCRGCEILNSIRAIRGGGQ